MSESSDLDDLVPPAALAVENKIGHHPDQSRSDEVFRTIGEGITRNMIAQGFIKPDYRVLDVGCGLGRLARPLTRFLSAKGEYRGIDAVKSSVDWCTAHYRPFPNFQFQHADVFSTYYNPTSNVGADRYVFPFEDNTFDFVFSTSLFSHMQLREVDNYLGQMARVLKPNGQCWNTCLLLDAVAESLADRILPHKVEGGRVADPDIPEGRTGLDEEGLRASHARHGLEIVDIRNGPWSGRKDNLRAGHQDVVIGRKMPGGR